MVGHGLLSSCRFDKIAGLQFWTGEAGPQGERPGMARVNPAGRAKKYGGRSSVGRAPDCDSGCRGFDPHRSPHLHNNNKKRVLINASTNTRTTISRKRSICI